MSNSNPIESDFELLVSKINLKLKEASAALREANNLAEEAKLPGLIYTQFTRDCDSIAGDLEGDELDEYLETIEDRIGAIDVSELENELQYAGWSTSSSYC